MHILFGDRMLGARRKAVVAKVGLLVSFMQAFGCQPATPIARTESPRLGIPVRPAAPATSTAVGVGSAEPDFQQLPGELPRNWPKEFERQQRCDAATCRLARWLPEPGYALTPLEEIPTQAALWVHDLTARAQLSFPPNTELELLVLPLQGTLRFRELSASGPVEKQERVLPTWSALRAPGAGVELQCQPATKSSCRIALALIAPDSTLNQALALPRGSFGGASQLFASRQLEVRNFHDAPTYAWNRGRHHARIVFGGKADKNTDAASNELVVKETGATTQETQHQRAVPFSLTLLQADASVSIASHVHEDAWEHSLVLGGSGALELRGRSYTVQGGEALHIPPKARHGYASGGTQRLTVLQLFTPAGPELRFVEAATRSIEPNGFPDGSAQSERANE